MSRLLSALVISPLALAAAACSDPPPTPAAMGISINLTPPSQSEVGTDVDISGKSCAAEGSGSATYSVGQPAPNKTIENGKGGVTVDCTVRGDGSFTAAAAGLETITKQRISLNVSGVISDASAKVAGTGALQFYTPGTGALYTRSPFPDCTFGPVTTMKKGALLADITCPIIVGENPQDGCRAKGTIAFEYCKTGEEED